MDYFSKCKNKDEAQYYITELFKYFEHEKIKKIEKEFKKIENNNSMFKRAVLT